MYNHDFETFKSLARIASETLDTMSLIWEKMQRECTEPEILTNGGGAHYPVDMSFDEFAETFNFWANEIIDYDEPKKPIIKTECIYTGGGIWIAIKRVNDIYYTVDTENMDIDDACINCFDRTKEDRVEYDMEYPCSSEGLVWSKGLKECTELEIDTYFQLVALLEKNTNL